MATRKPTKNKVLFSGTAKKDVALVGDAGFNYQMQKGQRIRVVETDHPNTLFSATCYPVRDNAPHIARVDLKKRLTEIREACIAMAPKVKPVAYVSRFIHLKDEL